MTVTFYGYTKNVDSLRKAQMILAQAKRERKNGDIDKWYYAGTPVGKAYKKWAASQRSNPKLPSGRYIPCEGVVLDSKGRVKKMEIRENDLKRLKQNPRKKTVKRKAAKKDKR